MRPFSEWRDPTRFFTPSRISRDLWHTTRNREIHMQLLSTVATWGSPGASSETIERQTMQWQGERVHWKEKRDESLFTSCLFPCLVWFGGFQEKSKSPTKDFQPKDYTRPEQSPIERGRSATSIIGQCDLWTEHRLPWLLLLPSLRPEDLPIPNPLIYDPFTNSFVFFARTRFWSYSWWA